MPRPPGLSLERIRELLADGLTPRQIAHLYGLSTQAIYQRLKKYGYNPDGTPVSK